jgi:hypothetical protein
VAADTVDAPGHMGGWLDAVAVAAGMHASTPRTQP